MPVIDINVTVTEERGWVVASLIVSGKDPIQLVAVDADAFHADEAKARPALQALITALLEGILEAPAVSVKTVELQPGPGH